LRQRVSRASAGHLRKLFPIGSIRSIIFVSAVLLAGGCGGPTRAPQSAQSANVQACPGSGVESHGCESGREALFLDDLARRSFLFFWEQADPGTGLIADRAGADGGPPANPASRGVASIASVGFGLTGVCIADRRGWLSHEQAYARVLTTLSFLHDRMPHQRGFFYHFVDMKTGRRVWDCELSSIDTALLMAGVLTARQHFKGTEVERLATQLYERVEWPWMLAGCDTLAMGWRPEGGPGGGFLPARWGRFSEHPILYLLAIGSPTHPLDPECWHAWRREPVVRYAGRQFVQQPPLFVHQFPHAWVDFRGRRDDYLDHWQNSVDATLAHRQFCIDLGATGRFPKYGPPLWGITASDSAGGYVAWGGPPESGGVDGTVVPCAAAGSLPFAPRECLQTLLHMREAYAARVWKRYGFVDAFNPHTGWTASDVIGIDVGITLLMVENHRSGWVWECFMRNEEIGRAMAAAGFRTRREGE
jgi:hypothetical protein